MFPISRTSQSSLVHSWLAFAHAYCLVVAVMFLAVGIASPVQAQSVRYDLFVQSYSPSWLIRLNGSTGQVIYSEPNPGLFVTAGPDGALYNSVANVVRRLDPETGNPLFRPGNPGGRFAIAAELSNAVGMAFGPDGNLYVASQDNSAVIRFNGVTGALVDAFIPPDNGVLTGAEALTFGPDGNLYVTDFTSEVRRFNGATGAFMGIFAADAALIGTRSLAFGPDGDLYVAGPVSNNVVQFDGVTGTFERVFALGVNFPNGLAFGPDGNLYVGSEEDGKIVRFDGTSGMYLDDFATGLPPSLVGMTFAAVPIPEPTAAALSVVATLIWLVGVRVLPRT